MEELATEPRTGQLPRPTTSILPSAADFQNSTSASQVPTSVSFPSTLAISTPSSLSPVPIYSTQRQNPRILRNRHLGRRYGTHQNRGTFPWQRHRGKGSHLAPHLEQTWKYDAEDKEKMYRLEKGLCPGGQAEEWWNELKPTDKKDWVTLMSTFEAKWAKPNPHLINNVGLDMWENRGTGARHAGIDADIMSFYQNNPNPTASQRTAFEQEFAANLMKQLSLENLLGSPSVPASSTQPSLRPACSETITATLGTQSHVIHPSGWVTRIPDTVHCHGSPHPMGKPRITRCLRRQHREGGTECIYQDAPIDPFSPSANRGHPSSLSNDPSAMSILPVTSPRTMHI
ncbi:hypothetical protein B0H10DRAFT_1971354 [Mycena sp. CBHHK59/15]|nr:hypothetical protein B0H10DRAFT_1971354 [Mycena sp. CBHHK59/15]